MALKIQRLQLVLVFLVAMQENVPAMSARMAFPLFKPPGLDEAKCIKSHAFGSGDQTIHLKQRCDGGCSGNRPKDGDICVVETGTSGFALIFLSGVCQNKTCKIENDSEIYKQEMNVSLGSNDEASIPRLPGCGFTSVQDKNRQHLLSTECTSCESQLNQTQRPDCTPCIASREDTESGDLKLTVGECHNGTCVPRNPTETVDVKKELISNSD
ncbi:uncharacterized protein LOC115321966 [Ixodes scapularis]|uniref:uncharacterized protein LOC115321966 n=1 Tax=Ixodes scapularis TaxID=6945 RepID=UPI001A9CD4E8|nr:uncharacterized protein LOC115321966 [Ixodes scapularis]